VDRLVIEFNGGLVDRSKQFYMRNQSKHLELPHKLMFLIDVTILNILISYVCKIVLYCQPTTIKLLLNLLMSQGIS